MNAEIIPSSHHAVFSFFVLRECFSRSSYLRSLGPSLITEQMKRATDLQSFNLCVDVLGCSKAAHSDYR